MQLFKRCSFVRIFRQRTSIYCVANKTRFYKFYSTDARTNLSSIEEKQKQALLQIQKLIQKNKLKNAYQLLHSYKNDGIPPNEIMYASLLQGCVQTKDVLFAVKLVEEMGNQHIKSTLLTCNALMSVFVACKKFEMCNKVFEAMMNEKVLPDTETFCIIIKGLCEDGEIDKVRHLLSVMEALQVPKNAHIFEPIIKFFVNENEMDIAEKTFEMMKEEGVEPNYDIYFEMAKGYLNTRRFYKLETLFKELKTKEIQLDEKIFIFLIKGFIEQKDMKSAEEVIEEMKELNITPTIASFSPILNAYSSEPTTKSMKYAHKLVEKMRDEYKIEPDEKIFVNLIKGFVALRQHNMVLRYIQHVRIVRTTLTRVMYDQWIKSCCLNGDLGSALQVFREMEEYMRPSSTTYGIIIKAYIEKGRMEDAKELLDEMKKKKIKVDVNCYVPFLEYYHSKRNYLKIKELMIEMNKLKIEPNDYVLNLLSS